MLVARSIDAALLRDVPRLGADARIHSVFTRVVNVVAGGDRLVTLACRDSDDAPDTVVVDLDAWPALDLVPGMRVRFSAQRIDLGNDVVALERARPWRAALPRYGEDDATLSANLAVARRHLEQHGSGIGLAAPSSAASELERALATAFRRATQGLCDALGHGDAPSAIERAEQLVGLGPGLTPAGDDFLLGLLAVLNIRGAPCAAPRALGARIVACANVQTPLISAATLRHAAQGRVRARVTELVRALMVAPAPVMLAALAQVLRIGSTSGTEIALGVLAGFELQLRVDEPRCALAS